MPIASATTANIGTPRTKAANIRWTSAAIHTAARAPMTGNSPYAWLVSATAWSATTRSGVIRSPSAVVRGEKRLALGEVDRQPAAHLRQQRRRHLPAPPAQAPEQGRRTPDLREALGAEVARNLGQVRAGRELAVRRDAAVLRAARAAGLVVQDRGVGIALVHVAHEVWGALRAHQHLAAIAALPARQVGEHALVLGRA